jgi:hypothetical protein
MLWTAQLRETARQLIANALKTQGADVQSDRDVPVVAGSGDGPNISVYVDDEMEGDYGTGPQFINRATVTIEIRAVADSKDAAQALRDALNETVRHALLKNQGFAVQCLVVPGSKTVQPTKLDGLAAGMPFMGDFAGQDNYFEAIDVQAGTCLLKKPWNGQTEGTYQFTIGSFIGLFERIERVKTYTHDGVYDKKRHEFGATIEIVGRTHEIFDLEPTQSLSGLNIWVDSINVFDPSGAHAGEEGPFGGNNPPRESGPDGRPEIATTIPVASP